MGGQIILHLIQAGVPPEAIRIVDLVSPVRENEFAQPPASAVAVELADITSKQATIDAFTRPWPAGVGGRPLTVFHAAAVIRPFERHDLVYHRCYEVNVKGTANVLAAASTAKADLFIYTSSCTVGHWPVHFLSLPASSAARARSLVQLITVGDFTKPLRPAAQFATNYARSKGEAERLVSAADEPEGMRTGIIRPGNAVYGHREDKVLGRMLALRSLIPSFGAKWAQNWIGAVNASLAHLQLEDALLGRYGSKLVARPFLVTDDGHPLRLADVYRILDVCSTTGLRVVFPPPALMLTGAYIVEAWALAAARWPAVKRMLGEPMDPVMLFQPAVFSAGVSAIVDDSEARKSPAEGGFGYRAGCSSLEGMCSQALDWNEWLESRENRST